MMRIAAPIRRRVTHPITVATLVMVGAVAILGRASTSVAQGSPPTPAQPLPTAAPPSPDTLLDDERPAILPFGVGESAQYSLAFGRLPVGSASMTVADVEEVRGRPAFHTTFRVRGGHLFFRVNDLMESWFDTTTLSSLQFHQLLNEGPRSVERLYEINPNAGTYTELHKTPPRTHPGVRAPLDDGSLLYFLRTMPLEVGRTYELNRYFRPESNPVRIRVLRHERVRVPAGTFDCIVVQPLIKTEGIFSQNGRAEVWLSNDARHIVVQLKSQLRFGSLNLYLTQYRPPAP